jgi:hypothetical protein
MRYFWNEGCIPQVTTADYHHANNPEIMFEIEEMHDLNAMWEAACSMDAAFPELIPDPQIFTDTVNLRLEDMNRYLTWLLQADPTKRPSVERVCLHMAANAIRKSLELGKRVFQDSISAVIV